MLPGWTEQTTTCLRCRYKANGPTSLLRLRLKARGSRHPMLLGFFPEPLQPLLQGRLLPLGEVLIRHPHKRCRRTVRSWLSSLIPGSAHHKSCFRMQGRWGSLDWAIRQLTGSIRKLITFGPKTCSQLQSSFR